MTAFYVQFKMGVSRAISFGQTKRQQKSSGRILLDLPTLQTVMAKNSIFCAALQGECSLKTDAQSTYL